ncbi:PadR family transcriptional regulator [Pontibacillus sp. ALD_SL1]|uniref:PadR family transcriptional regulator n=1 Tax=Pontibacillus sp. ALD_SL1 TaxID=2777185 RepID=UPI001A9605F2|nr:PadR family transcriptional regulator [Pontibacillus sp. ALD_SL1]QSS99484.1 PadR family transcriptional regulator [Pontibacillus sp. ALD_SL1]
MAIRYALLGLLTKGPHSGYDLHSTFKTQHIYFWNSTHSQVYQELNKMRDEELVTYETIVQEGSPNKKLYTITHKGEKRLIEWMMEEAIKPAKIKDEFLLRVSAFQAISVEEAITLLQRILEREKAILAGTSQWQLEHYGEDAHPSYLEIGSYLTSEFGKRYARMYVEWCEWTLELLESYRT